MKPWPVLIAVLIGVVAYALIGWTGLVCLAAVAVLALGCHSPFCDDLAWRATRRWRW